jgi:hypothetical protein
MRLQEGTAIASRHLATTVAMEAAPPVGPTAAAAQAAAAAGVNRVAKVLTVVPAVT